MQEVVIVGPSEGNVLLAGPVHVRIIEDGSTTSHRLGIGESRSRPMSADRRSIGTPTTTRVSTSSRAQHGSPSVSVPTMPRPARW
jgi:hypothetical protein